MNLILLAGNSIRNRDWIREVDNTLADLFTKTYIHHYEHWSNGNEFIDFDLEAKRLSDEAKSIEPYAIFAKSAGSVLAIKCIYEQILKPNACLFVGLPLKLIIEEHLPVDKWLEKIELPITIMQNDNDPVGNYEQVLEFINNLGKTNITVLKANNNTHDYTDFDRLNELSKILA